MFILILFGPPGAGKGTQAARIAAANNWVHVSTGDILRKEVEDKTPMGLQVKAVMDAGHLVPDELLIEIMKSVFLKHSSAAGFVLDGFPRTLNQASALDKMLEGIRQKISVVLSLVVDEPELLSRLVIRSEKQGRSDDSEEIIKYRLLQYHKHTKPLIEYYLKKNIFREVPGKGSVDDIFRKLCDAIDEVKGA